MQHRHSSPYYPQCNGLVEHANGQVMQMLTKYVAETPDKWDEGFVVPIQA